MFIDYLQNDPVYYLTVVSTVTVSIVLHELGHGVAAIAQGDDTPLATGHMTWNPLVHMGAMGLGLLLIVGVAFGAMPVNPSRFRSRHGEAIVAAAGPAVNAVLAFVSLTTFALLLQAGIDPRIGEANPLWILGLLNIVLFLFNMIPLAPLDGSAVLGSFLPRYRAFLRKPENNRFIWIAFGVVFIFAGQLFRVGADIATAYVEWVLGAA